MEIRSLMIAVSILIATGMANAQTAAGPETKGASTAKGVVMQRNVSLDLARTIADAALAECHAQGHHNTVAVLDRTGQILVIMRDEQSPANTAEMARRKAYTAIMFNVPTKEFQKRTLPEDPRAGQRNVNDILPLSGGVPIKVGNEVIGAVGSSGSGLDADDACANAGIAKVADQLK